MGKNKKKNKRRINTKPVSNESETAENFTNKTSEVETDGEKFTDDNSGRPTGLIQATGHSPLNMTEEKKDQYYYTSTDHIPPAKKSSITSESDLIGEDIKELENVLVEYTKQYISRLKNGERRISDKKNICTLNSLHSKLKKVLAGRHSELIEELEIYIKQLELSCLKENASSAEETVNLAKAEVYDEMKKSKGHDDATAQVTMATADLEYRGNEVSLDLETGEKKGDCNISADDIQKASHTQHNIESKKDGKKGTGNNRCTDCIQVEGNSPQNVPERIVENEIINMSKGDNRTVEQMKECSVLESETRFSKKERDLLSTQKQYATSPGEARCETGMASEQEFDTIDHVSTTDAQYHKGDGIIDKIYFVFGNDGYRYIKLGSKNLFFSSEEKQKIFDCKSENVKISFIGDQIFVSTSKNEFEFSVRKHQPVYLRHETRQTDGEP